MVNGDGFGEFLTTRRSRVSPEAVGLRGSGRRRVAGLRREEVAMLAGISVEYYTQLERGNARGASDDVLEAVARVLRLDDVERAHLFDLVHAAKQRPTSRRRPPAKVSSSVQRVLDAMTGAVAFVRNEHLEILAANRLGYALYADAFSNPARPVSLARFVFLDPRAQGFYVEWGAIADVTVGTLRAQAARDPFDRELAELIGELSVRSDEFRLRWATHDVGSYRTGVQRFRHELVGELTLSYDTFKLTAEADLTMVVYTAEVGSASQGTLERLAGVSREVPR
jgi:hypothetical protein